ncbi:hypothetical protein K8T06_02130 [bacterium]|nr:hypothetical protein [bacterium]
MRKAMFPIIFVLCLLTSFQVFAVTDTTMEIISWSGYTAPVISGQRLLVENVSDRLNASGGYDLPMISRTFTYPKGSKIHDLNIKSLQFDSTVLAEPLAILPAKPTVTLISNPGAIPNPSVISNSLLGTDYYPNCWYELEVRQGLNPETLLPAVFATVRLYPVRVHGIAIKYLKNFEAELIVSKTPEYDDKGNAAMLIIAPQSFIDAMNDFIAHKTNQGLEVMTRSTEDIFTNETGRDDQ